MKLTNVFLFGVVVASTTALAQTAAMRPGQYETTVEISRAGRAMKMPLRATAVCVTAEDLKDWSRNVVKTSEGTTCKLSDYKPSGATLTFVRECTSASGTQTTYKGTVTFTPPDEYRSVVNVSGSGEATPLAGSTMTTTAKRVGDCAK
jgi:hypothetical protein